MDKNKALELILANACCTLEDSCQLCPYYADPPSKECESFSMEDLRKAVEVIQEQKKK